jgi:beta-lactamase regulating signal transducer with metallopeptidase domain
METFLFYLLRVSIATTILYLFFKFILSKRTFHAINRIVVLCIVVMTLILPLFTVHLPEISFFKPRADQLTIEGVLVALKRVNYTNTVSISSTPAVDLLWIKIIGLIYLAGLIVALLWFIISFIRMSRIISAARKERIADNCLLCISEKNVSPFSWMKYIVLSSADFEADSRDIICHEQAHVAFRHSFDLLFLDIYILVFWFNPFAWLLRQELQIIHEYQADEKVLAEGVDAKNYQLLLIRQCVGEYKFALANNFEFNNLHKRIKMTMKTRSTSKQKWLYGTIGLSIMLCIAILSLDGLKVKAAAANLNETIRTEILRKTPTQTFDSVKVTKETVNVIPLTINNDAKPAKSTEKKLNAEKKAKSIQTIGSEMQAGPESVAFNPVIFIDGQESSQSLKSINLEDVSRIGFVKGVLVTKICGDKGKNGVVLISTKKKDNSLSTNEKIIMIGSEGNADFYKKLPQALILVDGKDAPANFIQTVSPNEIKSITVLKDSAVTSIYKTRGKNVVVLIEMKNKQEQKI